jgi:hypothetical protein
VDEYVLIDTLVNEDNEWVEPAVSDGVFALEDVQL